MEDQPCTTTTSASAPPGTQNQPQNYNDLLSKCGIDPNSTKDGAVLPVCVHKRVPTLVLTNYTQTRYARYLNDSKYIGAGVGSEEDWMVVVLTTKTPAGNFMSGAGLVADVSLGYCLVLLLLGSLVYLSA